MSSRENFEIVATFKNICDNSKYSFVVDFQGKEEIVNNIYLDNLNAIKDLKCGDVVKLNVRRSGDGYFMLNCFGIDKMFE